MHTCRPIVARMLPSSAPRLGSSNSSSSCRPSLAMLSSHNSSRLSCCSSWNRRSALVSFAAKGFASGKSKKAPNSSSNRKGQRVGPQQQQPQQAPVSSPQPPAGLSSSLQNFDDLEAARRQAAEDAEFQERLALIKAEAAQRKAAGVATPAAGSPSGSSTPRAVFDAAAEPEDIYANPPSLMSTLQDKLQPDIQDPALRQAQIGPGQLGLAGGAVLFGLVFLLVSGGDFATTNRYKGMSARPPPDPIEMSRLEQQAEGFETLLKQDPNDLQSLEAAAVTYARMQDYGKAASYLDKLTAARPSDTEALRLLGESRLLNAEPAKSVAAYEKAISLAPNDQSVITGLVDAYVANSQQGTAIDCLNGLRDKLLAAAAAGGSSSGSSENSAATAAVLPSSSEDASSSGSSSSEQAAEAASTSDRVPVDPVGVQLLLGKAYAAWRGHDTDALSAYDTLIRAFPEDFRGYLAKGMFLRDRGRQGDAERMFMQAKFYAPDSMRAFVSARSGERAPVDLPDNGME